MFAVLPLRTEIFEVANVHKHSESAQQSKTRPIYALKRCSRSVRNDEGEGVSVDVACASSCRCHTSGWHLLSGSRSFESATEGMCSIYQVLRRNVTRKMA